MEKRQSVRNPWAVVLLIIALACAIAYGCAALGARIFSADGFGSYKTIEIANLQDLQATSNGFVYYDGSTVSSISSSGSVNWSYLVGAEAGFSATDYGVATWVGNTITLIDGKSGSTTYNGNMDADVLSACIGDQYTAILVGEETNSTIVLMESGGKQVSQIVLEDVTAVDYGFFSNGTLLWVMVLDTNGTVPTCNIQTYRPGKEIVGSIHDNEQLSYAVMFQQSQVMVAGDTYLRAYDYTGTENSDQRRLVYGWYLSSFDENSSDPLMIFVNDAQCMGESDIQDVRMMRSNLDRVVHFPFGCMSVVAVGNTVYGFSNDGHLVMIGTDERTARSYQLNLRIDHVYGVTGDGIAILGNGTSVYLVSLK